MSQQHKEEKWFWLTLIGAFLITLAGCNHPSHLASIDDENVTLTDFAIRLAQVPGFRQATKEQQLAAAAPILESLIDDRVLYLEALAQGIEAAPSAVDHAMRQHEALLGTTLLATFTHQRGISLKALRRAYQQQLSALLYLKLFQIKEKPFCSGLGVQSSQNCIKRVDFMKSVRHKHQVRIHEGALARALDVIVGSADEK
jgi:hypothetical protein